MLNEEQKDVFVEIFNTGIGRASDSLSRLLGTFVELQKPVVRFLEFDTLQTYSTPDGSCEFLSVVQEIEGNVQGKGIISFPLTEGRTLIDILLANQARSEEAISDIEIEAITEVGNMVINSVASAIADMSSLMVAFGMPKTVFSQSMIPGELRQGDDLYCLAETRFIIRDLDISGFINLVFSLQHAEIIANQVLEKIIR